MSGLFDEINVFLEITVKFVLILGGTYFNDT